MVKVKQTMKNNNKKNSTSKRDFQSECRKKYAHTHIYILTYEQQQQQVEKKKGKIGPLIQVVKDISICPRSS